MLRPLEDAVDTKIYPVSPFSEGWLGANDELIDKSRDFAYWKYIARNRISIAAAYSHFVALLKARSEVAR